MENKWKNDHFFLLRKVRLQFWKLQERCLGSQATRGQGNLQTVPPTLGEK